VDGDPVKAEKIIKSPLQKSYRYLRSLCSDDRELAQLLIESDPEIDMEIAGRKVGQTDRILLDPDGGVLYATSEMEVIYSTFGEEVERREAVNTIASIDNEIPLVCSRKLFKRSEAVRRFVFTRNYQIRHIDGLTFDFLFNIASKLDQSDSLVLIGGGSNGADPILLERNGLPYRGFLEGRVNGDKYLLLLHLTRLELIQPGGEIL
jgi:hypothetical protein